jgi:hypothetical protein
MQPDPENAPPTPLQHESMLVTLLTRLFRESETLLSQELALVRAEITENIGRLIGGALALLIGLIIVFAGILALLASVIVLLALFIPLWIACALVGAMVLVAGVAITLYGRRLVAAATLVPQRTLESWRQTARWAEEELS